MPFGVLKSAENSARGKFVKKTADFPTGAKIQYILNQSTTLMKMLC